MQVSFQATVDEIADAHLRLFFETGTGSRDRTIASLVTAGLTAAAVFYFFRSASFGLVTPITVASAVLGYFLFAREYRRTARKKVRQAVVQHLGTDEPVSISVTIDPEALVVEQLTTTVRFGWDRIIDMSDLPAAIELRAVQPASLMRIPARAFSSFTDRAAFVRLARQYLEAPSPGRPSVLP